jgi:hypothetical protein
MSGTFYSEIAEQLLANKSVQAYRKELENMTQCFEEQVDALFEAKYERLSGGVAAAGRSKSVGKEIENAIQATGENQKKSANNAEKMLHEKFANLANTADWGGALSKGAKWILQQDEHEKAIRNFVFAVIFDYFLNKAGDTVSDEEKYKELIKRVKGNDTTVPTMNFLLNKRDKESLFYTFLKFLNIDAFAEASKKQEVAESYVDRALKQAYSEYGFDQFKKDTTGEENSNGTKFFDVYKDVTASAEGGEVPQSLTDELERLSKSTDSLLKEDQLKKILTDEAKKEASNIPGIQNLVAASVITAIQLTISKIINKPDEFIKLLKEFANDSIYRNEIENAKNEYKDEQEQKNFQSLYDAVFLQKEIGEKEEEDEVDIEDTELQKALTESGQVKDLYNMLSTDVVNAVLNVIRNKMDTAGNTLKESMLMKLTEGYRNNLNQEISSLTEDTLADELEKGTFDRKSQVKRIARVIYVEIVKKNPALEEKYKDTKVLAKQIIEMLTEYSKELNNQKRFQYMMSIVSTNDQKKWNRCLTEYFPSEKSKQRAIRFFKEMIGKLYSASIFGMDEISKFSLGANLNLNEAWNNLKQYAPEVSKQISSTVFNTIKTNAADLDKKLTIAANEIMKGEMGPQEPAEEGLPEMEEFKIDTQYKLYTHDDLFGYTEAKKFGEAFSPETRERQKALRFTIASVIIYCIASIFKLLDENTAVVEKQAGEEETKENKEQPKEANEEAIYSEGILSSIGSFIGNMAIAAFVDKLPTSFSELNQSNFNTIFEKIIESSGGKDKSQFKSIIEKLGFTELTDGLSEKLFSKDALSSQDTQTTLKEFINGLGDDLSSSMSQVSQKTMTDMMRLIYQPSKRYAKIRSKAEKVQKVIDSVKW